MNDKMRMLLDVEFYQKGDKVPAHVQEIVKGSATMVFGMNVAVERYDTGECKVSPLTADQVNNAFILFDAIEEGTWSSGHGTTIFTRTPYQA